jgi:hypothetical protein
MLRDWESRKTVRACWFNPRDRRLAAEISLIQFCGSLMTKRQEIICVCPPALLPQRLLPPAHSMQRVTSFNSLKHHGYFMLNVNSPTFCPHSVFVYSVWSSEQGAIISVCNINGLVFITETEFVYCAVRTEALNKGCFIRNLAHFGKTSM